MLEKALSGDRRYRGWILFLLAIVGTGIAFYRQQFVYGLGITGMSRDVSWGLYIANFTFFVGVAASAVMVVLPYYLHRVQEFKRMTILGEFLAVAAVMMAGLFVLIDLGQPSRVVNLLLYPSPNSMLFWDVVVLSIYLLLNLIIGWTTLDSEHKSEPSPGWVRPLIMLSIPWAISIHTITAFIYSGLGARSYWLTALMAPRFLASAFASGPALLIILSIILKRYANFDPGKAAVQKIAQIVAYATGATLFFWIVEFFTVFYSQIPEHTEHFYYLLFGAQGRAGLAPFIWVSMGLAVAALVLLINPRTRQNERLLTLSCAAVFVSIWIDKGLALVVPGFTPSPAGAIFEYQPTLPEVLITLGVWALGFLVLTGLFKIAAAIYRKAGEPVGGMCSKNIAHMKDNA